MNAASVKKIEPTKNVTFAPTTPTQSAYHGSAPTKKHS
jgi:hypothetical protein